jgi:hypothetical protein
MKGWGVNPSEILWFATNFDCQEMALEFTHRRSMVVVLYG